MLMYDLDESGNCYKVRLLAALLGIRIELVPLDDSDRETQLGRLNSALEVPTLVLDDGRPLSQSDAILLYLANGTPLLPDDPYLRAEVTRWLFFEQSSHGAISQARFWLRWGEPDDYQSRLPACQAEGYAALDVMEQHLTARRFLVDETYSVADIALYAYTHVADEAGLDLGRCPQVQAWLSRVAAQPGHVPISG